MIHRVQDLYCSQACQCAKYLGNSTEAAIDSPRSAMACAHPRSISAPCRLFFSSCARVILVLAQGFPAPGAQPLLRGPAALVSSVGCTGLQPVDGVAYLMCRHMPHDGAHLHVRMGSTCQSVRTARLAKHTSFVWRLVVSKVLRGCQEDCSRCKRAHSKGLERRHRQGTKVWHFWYGPW